VNIARLQTTPLVDQTPATERGLLRGIVHATSIAVIEPVVPGVWVSRGATVNAVGA